MAENPLGAALDTFRNWIDQPDFLQTIDGFPYSEYVTKVGEYEDWENWFDGTSLDAQQMAGSAKVDKYPVRINPLYSACMKHAYALYGEVDSGHRPLVVPKMFYDNESEQEAAQVAEKALGLLWWENSGRALQMQNGINSQVYGGSIYKLAYTPWERTRRIPIQIEAVGPKYFYGVPKAGDPFRLRQAWFVKILTHAEAKQYGVEVGEGDVPIWIEYWDEGEYAMKINDTPIKPPNLPEQWKAQGKNPWGFVPAVYTPHLRTDGFWGDSLIPNLVGLVKELNLRVGDLGDAISDDAHKYVYMRNVSGTPRRVTIAPGLEVIDLGSSPNITGQEAQPELQEITKASASTVMLTATDKLYLQFRRDAFLPAVADGEDEGSQRSAMTLNVRFWPLVSHITMERWNQEAGLNLLSTMALKMMQTHSLAKVTESQLELPLYQDWAPVLPRDREQLVSEVVQRAVNNLGTPEHLLTLLGDVQDPSKEEKEILEWMKAVAEVQKIMQPDPQPNQNGSNSNDKRAGKSQS